LTVVSATNLLPVIVRVKAAPPTVALAGEKALLVGTPLLISKVSGADSPPLGSGSKTVTAKLPATAISVEPIVVLNWVASTKVVVLSRPSTRITKPSTKPVPLTVRLNPAPPAVALDGERLLTLGAPTIKAALVRLLKTLLLSLLLND
jgi:hypothetical protein